MDGESETFVPVVSGTLAASGAGSERPAGNANEADLLVAHSLRADGFDASEDGTGRGTPLVAIPFDTTQITSRLNRSNPKLGDPCHPLTEAGHPPTIAFSCEDHGADAGDTAPTLRGMGHDQSHANAGGQVAVAFQESQTGVREYESAGSLRANGPGHDPVGTRVRSGMAVRRLTPRECERLMGLPDGYTAIPYRGKLAADGPRYKAIGNGWAVPVLRWIGERIEVVDALQNAPIPVSERQAEEDGNEKV